MIKYDFKTYTKNYYTKNEYNEIMFRKNEIMNKLKNSNMNGWTKKIDNQTVNKIKETANFINKNFDCLVVIGIGGSFLGSFAVDKLLSKYFCDKKFEIIYAGTSLSSEYLNELINYLKNKNYCINVISKSANTMETNITYKLLKNELKRRYNDKEIKKRIIITTDKEKGQLRKEVNEMGYTSFIIPDNIGGRFSFITPAHLLPLATNYNIDEIINGYYQGEKLLDIAYEYAAVRYLLYKHGKVVENFAVTEEKMIYFSEWIKQVFGETEGKNESGILPFSTVFTRDLHSLGQFIQEGNKILFETFIKVKKTDNFIKYNDKTLSTVNNLVINSVIKAHSKGNVPCLEIEIEELTEKNIGLLIYFFQLSASFSGYLFGVEPFNQPGVEIYKKEVRKTLNN